MMIYWLKVKVKKTKKAYVLGKPFNENMLNYIQILLAYPSAT